MRTKNLLTQPIRGRGLLLLLGAILVLVLGNYHVVSDAPTLLVERPYFGFSDMFASAKVCTSGPWLFAKAQHPSLCRALQDAGLIESDDDFESRIHRENVEETQARQECTNRCDVRSRDYVACMSAC